MPVLKVETGTQFLIHIGIGDVLVGCVVVWPFGQKEGANNVSMERIK